MMGQEKEKLCYFMGKIIFDYSMVQICPTPWTDHDLDLFLSINKLELFFLTVGKSLSVQKSEISLETSSRVNLYYREMNQFIYYMVLSEKDSCNESRKRLNECFKDADICLSRNCSTVKEMLSESSAIVSRYHMTPSETIDRYDMVYQLYMEEDAFFELLRKADYDALKKSLKSIAEIVHSLNELSSYDGYFSFIWRYAEREIFRREGRMVTSKEKIVVDKEIAQASSIDDQIEIVLKYMMGYVNEVDLPNYRSYNKAIQRIKDYVKNNCDDQNISLKYISEKMKLSENYLSRLFKRTEGISFSAFVKKVRMDKAKELLESGKYNICEVSRLVGFKYQSYFSRVYHEHFGINPEDV